MRCCTYALAVPQSPEATSLSTNARIDSGRETFIVATDGALSKIDKNCQLPLADPASRLRPSGRPERGDRHAGEPVAGGQCPFAEVQDDTAGESLAEAIT